LIDETAVASANLAGLRTLSEDQTIPFTLYQRYVLPLDGYVFWLGTSNTIPVRGSIHVSADSQQREDESIAINRVVMTTGEEVSPFNHISPNQIWVGEISGVRFAFSRSGPRYRVAGFFHYNGDALYPAMSNLLVPLGAQLPTDTLVVSNSLPMWLSLQSYTPIWSNPPNPGITLYPSFAIPDNLPPPYGAVHIDPGGTSSLQATPLLGPLAPIGGAALGIPTGTTLDTTHWQLVSDHVRITLYGLTNSQAMDFIDLVNRYSYDLGDIGMMSATPMRDEKRTQNELNILAMKKVVEFTVSYYQTRANHVARQLIEHASVALTVNPFLV
jgi:hypothetical protein